LFNRFDAGKVFRTHKIQGSDCTVRALCTAVGIPYNEAYDLLYRMQGQWRTNHFALDDFLKLNPETFGVIRYLPFPAKKGCPRMTGEQFTILYPKGRYILNLAHHLVAVVHGSLTDKWDSSQKCVYGAWEVRGGTVSTAATAPSNTKVGSKDATLRKLAQKRVPVAVDKIRLIGNLANYNPTPQQVEKIMDALRTALKKVEERLRGSAKEEKGVPDEYL
jgi:hypothetical protein